MKVSPGTVSQILWHFTGGPLWNSEKEAQGKEPKPVAKAYDALVGILKARQLRIGSYKEVVKIAFPKPLPEGAPNEAVTDMRIEKVESKPVTCLADIPVAHLGYHAKRYGYFAIGFRREAAIKAGFNPVLYTLHNTNFLQAFFDGLARLDMVNTDVITDTAHRLDEKISKAHCAENHPIHVEVTEEMFMLHGMKALVDAAFETAKSFISESLAFIKTFHNDEFESIYCEREWRSVKAFDFDFRHIAMIVLPRKAGGKAYFDEFVKTQIRKLKLPRSIPVVPWEDLVEH
jgi:abortive phage resistance protein AbiGi (putative antitoxin)